MIRAGAGSDAVAANGASHPSLQQGVGKNHRAPEAASLERKLSPHPTLNTHDSTYKRKMYAENDTHLNLWLLEELRRGCPSFAACK